MNIPFNLMLESEYKSFLFEREVDQLMANPLEVVEKYTQNQFGLYTPKQISAIVGRDEETALYYVNNTPVNRANRDILTQSVKWRSVADKVFPDLRRYMDDEVRNEIILQHSDYSVFAIKALEMNISDSEITGLIHALVSNSDTVEQGVDYIRKNSSNEPWKYNLALSRAAYTSETIAWELVKEFPKTLVFSGASRWKSLASRMVRSNKVEASVHRACMRHHEDIAAEFVGTNNVENIMTIFLQHPGLRERILRRKDLNKVGVFNSTLKSFIKFQEKLKNTLEDGHKKAG